MATFDVARLVGKTNKAGLTSWYWQPSASLRKRGWAALALGSSHGDTPPPDVVDAARAENGRVDGAGGAAIAAVRIAQRPLTLAEGIARYKASDYPSVKRPGTSVAPSTAYEYGHKFKTLIAWGGDVALTSITPQRVARLRDGLMAPAEAGRRAGEVRHHAAHETLRVGRSLFTWFEQQRLVPRGANPFADFSLAAPAPRDAIWWPAAREALFAACDGDRNAGLPGGSSEPDHGMTLAIDLAFLIGQREADLLRLTIDKYQEIPPYKLDPEVWEQLAERSAPRLDGVGAPQETRRTVMGIRLRQAKGKRWIEVPVVGATRARIEAQIAAAKKANVTTLLFDTRSGRPWTLPNLKSGQARFQRRFAEIREAAIAAATERQDHELAAEIAALQYRDFRRTAVVVLGELGIADHLIAAITGHSLDDTKVILDTYMPRTTGMAARAIALSQARTPAAPNKEQSA